MSASTTSTQSKGNAPYALSDTIDWADVRASLAAVSSPSQSPSLSSTSTIDTPTTSSDSRSNPINAWVSASSLATYLPAKEASRISSALWRGWVLIPALFDGMSADPKQTFNELVQKGLITGHKFSEYNCKATCRWIVTLDVEDQRMEECKFDGEHRSKGGAKGEAIRRLVVAIVKQHIGFVEE